MAEFCTVKRAMHAFQVDGPDEDADPDLVMVQGKITFTPLLGKGDVITMVEDGQPVSVVPRPITARVSNGLIMHRGREGVRLLAGGVQMRPEQIRYRASFSEMQAGGWAFTVRNVDFVAKPGGEVDLTLVGPVANMPDGNNRGPAGAGITDVHVDGSELVVIVTDEDGSRELSRLPLDDIVRAEADAAAKNAADAVRDDLAATLGDAGESASAADASAKAAATSAKGAADSASAAAGSAASASSSESAASASASDAAGSAETAERAEAESKKNMNSAYTARGDAIAARDAAQEAESAAASSASSAAADAARAEAAADASDGAATTATEQADRATTEADRATGQASAASGSADAARADAVATAADRVKTTADATATAADRVATGDDRVAAAQSATTAEGAASKATEQADRATTEADRSKTEADRAEAAADVSDGAAVRAVTDRVNTLLEGAPEAYDTLSEVAAKLAAQDDVASAMTSQIAGKADREHTHTMSDLSDWPQVDSTLVKQDDDRLSDSRNPLSHRHKMTDITGLDDTITGLSNGVQAARDHADSLLVMVDSEDDVGDESGVLYLVAEKDQ